MCLRHGFRLHFGKVCREHRCQHDHFSLTLEQQIEKTVNAVSHTPWTSQGFDPLPRFEFDLGF